MGHADLRLEALSDISLTTLLAKANGRDPGLAAGT